MTAPVPAGYRAYPNRPSPWLLPLWGLVALWRARSAAWVIARSRLGSGRAAFRLGALWWLLEPFIHVGGWFLFVMLVRGRTDPDYLLVVAAGVVPWRILIDLLTSTGDGFRDGAALLRHPRVPRMALPAASAIEALVRALVSLCVLLAIAAFSFPDQLARAPLVLLPILGSITVLVAFGAGLLLGAVAPFVPDVRRIVQVGVLRIAFFVTPVLWQLTPAQTGYELLSLNPLAGLFGLWHAALHAGPLPSLLPALPALLLGLALLLAGAAASRAAAGRVAAAL